MGKKNKGFTLIELLVVIAIIAVIASLVLPGLMKGKKQASLLKCLNNLKGLRLALESYSSDNYGVYPRDAKGADFWEVLRTQPTPETSSLGTKKDKMFICPLGGRQTIPGPGKCDYRGPNYIVSLAVDENDPLGADEPENHDPARQAEKINVLLFGGSVEQGKPGSTVWADAIDNGMTILKAQDE
ncbi:MAG: prepilin-type N-terminal cleavage/methylation domain-containing protein [Planctomycetes bacterium]|nr:prepilin-type N-terminal cleavage/methylation domain-containing protein [Planctomycetota bacterium]